MSRYFWSILTPSPCHTLSHIPGPPPESTSFISGPPFLVGLVQKIPDKRPLYKFYLNCSRRFFPGGGVVRGSFVWKVLSGLVFVRSPSVTIHLLQQKVKRHLKFHVSYV